MRILVTGATGFVGRHVVSGAIAAGHSVRALVRDPRSAAAAFGELPVDVLVGEVQDAAAVRGALANVDVLVHAAATYSYRRQDAGRMTAENPAMAETVLGAARDAATPHVIDVSSSVIFRPYAAGPRLGTADLESARWDARDRHWNDPYLRSKVLADAVGQRLRETGLPLSTVHPNLVVGPDDRGPGPSGAVLVNLLASPAVYVAAASNWVDVRDVAAGIVALATAPPGGRYIFSSAFLSYRDMATLIDSLTGRRSRRLWLSPAVTRAGAKLNDLAGGRLMADLPPRDSLEFILAVGPIDGSSGETLLGRPYRPLAETVTGALRWWADHGVVPRRLVGGL